MEESCDTWMSHVTAEEGLHGKKEEKIEDLPEEDRLSNLKNSYLHIKK